MFSGFLRGVGFALRESAWQTERLGCSLMGTNSHKERVTRWTRLVEFQGKKPVVDTTCFVAPNAMVVGEAYLGTKCGVFYSSTIRGDLNPVTVGNNTVVQDRCVIRGTPNTPTSIGSHVTIEPCVTISGAQIGDDCFIGAGAVVMEGARVEAQSIIAPGSTLQKFAVVPSGELWAGCPAEKVRNLTDDEVASLRTSALQMVGVSEVHKDATEKSFCDVEEEEDVTNMWSSLEASRHPIRAPYGQYNAGPQGAPTMKMPRQLMDESGRSAMQ